MSIGTAEQFAGVVVKCHAGCHVDDILAALELTRTDLFDEPRQAKQGQAVVAEYPYFDEAGNTLYVKQRLYPKAFRQYVPMPGGGRSWSLNGARRVLYQLPKLIAAITSGETVFLAEGEKDVQALEAAGVVATTWTEGAWKPGAKPKWRTEYSRQLASAHVIIVRDRDDAGGQTAADIAAELEQHAASVGVVESTVGKDVSDHLAAKLTLDELVPWFPPTISDTPAAGPKELEPESEGGAEPEPPSGQLEAFWNSRPVLGRIRDFARARRVGPLAVLGCVLVRVVAATPPHIVLPALVGGPASISIFLAVTIASGGGKGTAESAAIDAISLPEIPTFGPGSGEGLAHLFMGRNRNREQFQHTTAVILSAAEVDTMAALKGRQASTLFPELRKAWMGEPLGFAYADINKRPDVPRHAYRLCMSLGVQPERAAVLLDDADAGMPQRILWLPGDDPDAPDERPEEPQPWTWSNPFWSPSDALDDDQHRTHPLQPMTVCETANADVEAARLQRLRGQASDALDGHALLSQLKVAAALALLDGRPNVTEEDWQLAGTVRKISDRTRENVIKTRERIKVQHNRARGEAEADRALVVDQRRDEASKQRIGRSIMVKLGSGNWLRHSQLRRSLRSSDRPHFEDVISALIETGQVEERAIQTDRQDRQGIEYRKVEYRP